MNGSRALLFLVFSTRWLLTFETAVQLEFHFAFLDVFFLQFDQVVSVQGGIIFFNWIRGSNRNKNNYNYYDFCGGYMGIGKRNIFNWPQMLWKMGGLDLLSTRVRHHLLRRDRHSQEYTLHCERNSYRCQNENTSMNDALGYCAFPQEAYFGITIMYSRGDEYEMLEIGKSGKYEKTKLLIQGNCVGCDTMFRCCQCQEQTAGVRMRDEHVTHKF